MGSMRFKFFEVEAAADHNIRDPWQADWNLLMKSPMTTYVYETIPSKPRMKPRRFEVQQKMSDPPLKKDPQTGLPVKRVITGGSGNIYRGVSILSMNVKRSGKK